MSFNFTNTPSLNECEAISQGIDNENKIHGPHMIPVTWKNLYEKINIHGWLIARYKETNEVAGMVKLTLLDESLEVYEWWSLFVMPKFRWNKLWHLLIEWIVQNFHQKALLMVTNVPQVIHVSKNDCNQFEVIKSQIGSRLIKIIEWPQPLLPDDKIFVNQVMMERIKDIN